MATTEAEAALRDIFDHALLKNGEIESFTTHQPVEIIELDPAADGSPRRKFGQKELILHVKFAKEQ